MQMPSVEESLTQLKHAKYFSTLDLKSGYWQLPLTERTSLITAFITPFGRYVYKRLPQGLCSSPEVFQKQMEKILNGINGTKILLDDILIFASSEQDHDKIVEIVLQRLLENGVTLNQEKCHFKKTELKYLGHIIGEDGIKPDPTRISAIIDLAPPSNINELRRFLGMTNYLTKFIKNFSDRTKPLRDLLKKNCVYEWSSSHQKCFEDIKERLTILPVLVPYEVEKKTRISADASCEGVGGMLEQKQDDGTWRPVIYCSKSLSETEKRYAQIEKESLAILWTCERLEQYLIGKEFTIQTDHKPLVTLLGTKPIDQLSARLQRFRMRLAKFIYEIEFIPGKDLWVPDALSRAPLKEGVLDKDILENEINSILIGNIASDLNIPVEEFNTLQCHDSVIEVIKNYVQNGWPNKSKVDKTTLPYFKFRTEISLEGDVLCYKNRIIIPSRIRKEILNRIHTGHLGIKKCKARAKSSVWWPEINNQIEQLIENCEVCLKCRNDQVEPLVPTKIPKLPWSVLGVDLFDYEGSQYLVIIDYYSKYPEVFKLKNFKASGVIKYLKVTFSRFGIPHMLRTDNGPQFNCLEFKDFCEQLGVRHVTSSPHFPQSNGMVERAVQIVKRILQKEKDGNWEFGLLAYRNSALDVVGLSPAELLMGRKLRDTLPTLEKNLMPIAVDHKTVREKLKRSQNENKINYDRRHRSRNLEKLRCGQRVWVRDMEKEGKVKGDCEEPRSYMVDTEDGGCLRRNRRHLQPLPEESANKNGMLEMETSGEDLKEPGERTQQDKADEGEERPRRSHRIRRPPDWYRP